MLVIGGIVAFLFPLCVPCLALLAGAGAGYLAGVWERPGDNNRAIQRGAGAGAIGGAGALLGHLAGGIAAAVFVGPEGALDFARQLGLDMGSGATQPAIYYASATATACCFGVVEVALMAGLGALGGLLYWQMTGKNQAGGATPPPAWPA